MHPPDQKCERAALPGSPVSQNSLPCTADYYRDGPRTSSAIFAPSICFRTSSRCHCCSARLRGVAMTSKFPVGRYVCEMSWSQVGGLRCEWSPDAPPPRSLSKKEAREYRAGRDVFVQELASTIGGNILVVEVRA